MPADERAFLSLISPLVLATSNPPTGSQEQSAFFCPKGLLRDNTMRNLQKLLEWIFVMIDLYGLIDMLIAFIKSWF